jgi:3-oxoacyl-[acyl-carrier protein] reductase
MSSRKTVIITGAGSGIGAATAIAFARSGYDVAVNYSRNRTGAEDVVRQCLEAGADAIAIPGDETIRRFGRIDALVNNAGVTRQAPAGDLNASNAADFEAIFRVNVSGTYQMIRAAVPYLQKAPLGSIVNVSSDSAISGSGSSLAYAASKGAVNTMTRGLARTLAPHIRVNAVCPGFVDTSWALSWLSEDAYREFKAGLIAAAPLKSIPEASDIADAILWLSDRASRMTGQCLVIDGGASLVE